MRAPSQRPAYAAAGRGSFLAAIAFIVVLGVAFAHRRTLLRAAAPAAARELAPAADAAAAAAAAPAPDAGDVPTPNCGVAPAAPAGAAACAALGGAALRAAGADKRFTGVGGLERTLGSLFNRYDGKIYFPRGRALAFVQVGGSNIIDRYGALGRGPRLDDKLVLLEANSLTARRLAQRIRMDQRLLLKHAAAWETDAPAWFEYEKVPNFANNNGKVSLSLPANVSDTGAGEPVPAITLDALLTKVAGPVDFLYSDADGAEPFIFRGAAATLKRTRVAVFSCNTAWAAKGAGRGLAAVIKDVFEPAGLAVALLGEQRNVPLSHGLAPADFDWAKDVPAWGFCVAVHVAPPILRNLAEVARLLVGVDDAADACVAHVPHLGAAEWCKSGLLETLGGLDAPLVKSEYETPFY